LPSDAIFHFQSLSIGNVAFGLEYNCEFQNLYCRFLHHKIPIYSGLTSENSDVFKNGRRLAELTTYEFIKFFIANAFPDLCRKLHVTITPKGAGEFFMSSFLQTIEYREKNNINRNDFVSLLLGLKDIYTPQELAGESFIVFVGGTETSSILITFTCYELALNSEIQQKLRDEINKGLRTNNGKLTYDMIFGFKYLDMVVNESLRKYPPIPAATRKCVKDYQISGTNLTIPKGTTVQLPAFSLHRDPEHYPDPDKFDPERFNDENSKARNPFTFLPFAEGPRNCIGMRFGLMQSKIAIAKIVSNFEILPTEKTPIPMKFLPASPFLTPVGGMWLKLNKIEK
jgi:cytochrome P450 family 6